MAKIQKFLLSSLILFATGYALQLCILVFWALFPVDHNIENGKSYTITRNMGHGWAFIPLLGLLPLTGEPVRLVIVDLQNGKSQDLAFDIADDVYAEYSDEFDVELADWQKAK